MREAPACISSPPTCDRAADAALAAALIAVDPCGLGGACLHAPFGPARDAWCDGLRAMVPAGVGLRRVPFGVSDDRLLGGLDLAATLRCARPVVQRGLLADADGGFILLPMAERLESTTAGRIAAAMDRNEVALERDGFQTQHRTRFGVIAFDEGLEDEAPPSSLLDRLAFHIDLTGVAESAGFDPPFAREHIAAARARLSQVQASEAILSALCAAAQRLGVASLRGPLLALAAARALASLAHRSEVNDEDAMSAARLVLAARARAATEEASPAPGPSEKAREQSAQEHEDQPRSEPASHDEAPSASGAGELAERMVAAVQTAPPENLLARLDAAQSAARSRAQGRAGACTAAPGRGRPIGVQRGKPRAGLRLNVIETLRAAAPWQRLRRAERSSQLAQPPTICITAEDWRVVRTRARRQTTTVFIVDASGSTAMHRLAEAKGAVELLLGECYVRRDQVAVIGFRGRSADVLLPPTRSLVRAKRALAALPGGGGTPLAAAIDAGASLADAAHRRGESPTLVLLTDGQANVARDGASGRAHAHADALAAARRVRAMEVCTLFIDTSPRPQPLAGALAAELGALYRPLPFADAASVARVVQESARDAAHGPAARVHAA